MLGAGRRRPEPTFTLIEVCSEDLGPLVLLEPVAGLLRDEMAKFSLGFALSWQASPGTESSQVLLHSIAFAFVLYTGNSQYDRVIEKSNPSSGTISNMCPCLLLACLFQQTIFYLIFLDYAKLCMFKCYEIIRVSPLDS